MTLAAPAARVHLGPDRAAGREGRVPPGRRGGPVHRHAGRSGPRRDPRRAGRGRRTRPGTRRPGAPRSCGQAAAGWLARSHRFPSRRTTCSRSSGPRSSSPGCRSCSGSGPGDVLVYPELAYPTYDIGARLAGATAGGLGQPAGAGARPGAAGLAELAVQPDRAGAAGRAHAQGGVVGARARGGGRLRRVLHRPGLGGHAGLRAGPRGVRRLARRGCWPSTRCPSGPTWPATGPGS